METDSQPTPARLSSADRRQQLIDTATRLFARHGFSGTTTREIARAAGVNEAIIFRFFPHKDDLYAAILERKSAEARTDALIDALRDMAASDDDAGVIRAVVSQVIEHQRRDPEFLRLLLHSSLEGHSFARQYRERHFAPFLRFLFEYVRTRQQQGRFQAAAPETLVRAIIGIPAHHGLSQTLMPEDSVCEDDVVDTYTTFILKGLIAGPAPVVCPQLESSRD